MNPLDAYIPDGPSNPRAWIFLAIESGRQWGGNVGYADDPEQLYRFDSNVPNHLQVSPGDVVVIRSRDTVLGFSRIEQINHTAGTKELRRCPECGIAGIKKRRTKEPPWRCRNGHLFDIPVSEAFAVTLFEAHYGHNFCPLAGSLTVDALRSAVIRPSDQLSIQEVDLGHISQLLAFAGDRAISIMTSVADSIVAPVAPPPLPDDRDNRSLIQHQLMVMRAIGLRRGQPAFRKRLIRRYGLRCMISGCAIQGLIEAAHLRPYSSSSDNGAGNGLLLRSDFHTLFDMGMVGIDPDTLIIRIHPAAAAAGYGHFDGQTLMLAGAASPSSGALRERWRIFLANALSTGSDLPAAGEQPASAMSAIATEIAATPGAGKDG